MSEASFNGLALMASGETEPPEPIKVKYPRHALLYFGEHEKVGTLLPSRPRSSQIEVEHFWHQMARLYADPPPATTIGNQIVERAAEAVIAAGWQITPIDIEAQKVRDAIGRAVDHIALLPDVAASLGESVRQILNTLGFARLAGALTRPTKTQRQRFAELGANDARIALLTACETKPDLAENVVAEFRRVVASFHSLSLAIDASRPKAAQ